MKDAGTDGEEGGGVLVVGGGGGGGGGVAMNGFGGGGAAPPNGDAAPGKPPGAPPNGGAPAPPDIWFIAALNMACCARPAANPSTFCPPTAIPMPMATHAMGGHPPDELDATTTGATAGCATAVVAVGGAPGAGGYA